MFLRNGEVVNPPKEIKIGKHVWIGCRCTILKGSIISDNSIVAAGSLVTRRFTREKIVLGNKSADVLEEGIEWSK